MAGRVLYNLRSNPSSPPKRITSPRAPATARPNQPTGARVAIVGAGPGGLATSMLLAKKGFDVHIFEKEEKVGGRTSSIEADGFKFDLGPTFFMYPQVLKEIFDTCGFDLDTELPMERLDPQYRILFGEGGKIDATPNTEQMEAEIAKISPDDAPALSDFLADNREKFEAFKPILQRPFNGWKDVADPSLLKLLPLLRPGRSVDRDLKSFFKDPRIRLAFSFQSKYLGMSPFRCPSLFSILSFLEYEYGVFHPIGGCAAVTETLARLAEELGVSIHTGQPVEEILFQGRKATGVRTPSGSHHFDALTINADFAHAMRNLVPDHLRKRWTNKKIAKKKFSCSTFMLYLGIDGGYADVPHHNIFISEDYEGNLKQIEQDKSLPEQPSFYVQNPCVTDRSLAPEGKSALYVLVPVPHETENIDWSSEKMRYRDLVLDRLAKVGIENIRERIEFEHMITPDDWRDRHSIHMGATFNLAHTFKQMLHLRPRNRFEDLESVYLVGGGTHPGSGLPVIFESAKMTAGLLAEDFGAELQPRQTEQVDDLNDVGHQFTQASQPA